MLGMILARASGCEVSKRGLGSRRSFEKTVQQLA
jgi:hypothetical protein